MMRAWIASADAEPRLDAGYYRPDFVVATRTVTGSPQVLRLEELRQASRPICYGVLVPQLVRNGSGVKLLEAGRFASPSIDAQLLDEIGPEQHQQYRRSAVKQGDIVVAIGGYVGRAAVVPPELDGANINRHLARVSIDNDQVDPYFVWAFIESGIGTLLLERHVTGTAQPGINLEDLREIPTPAPKPAVARAIGNRVRRAERLRELALEHRRLLDRALDGRFGQPAREHENDRSWWIGPGTWSPERWNPGTYHLDLLAAEQVVADRWSGVEVRQVAKGGDIAGGATPKGASYPESGVRFIRTQNVQPDRMDLTDLVWIDADTDRQLRRSRLRPLDVLLTITGVYRGIAAVVPAHCLPANINQHSVRFAVTDDWNPYYVAAFLNCPWGAAEITRRAIGATRDALDYPSVLSILIPCIDRDEQDEIGEHARLYGDMLDECSVWVERAKAAVEALLDGSLDVSALLEESAETERWLTANPSPYGRSNGTAGAAT